MASTFTLFNLITYTIICVANSQWVSPDSTLPSANAYMVVGVHNGTIFILGGGASPRQMTEFQIETETFIPMTQTLPNDVEAWGQIWSQLDEMMYMIVGSTLSTFNMITKQYTNAWIDLNADVGGKDGCLAAVNDQIFVTGGYVNSQSIDTFQVLNVTSLQWISNTPSMQTKRCDHACVVHYNYLWVFGGWGSSPIKTNERIDITDITSNQWDFVGDLTEGAYDLRAATWQQSVFVTGGYQGDSNYIYLDTVHVADGITGEVVLAPERLVYPVASHGIVSIHNVIYLLGGATGPGGVKGVAVNTWMRYGQRPTIMPTSVPTTADPTTPAPTTGNPTTANPTTNEPTFVPSSAPTTSNPTTSNPTTNEPTFVPSSAPTTSNPTTSNPTTNEPTFAPSSVPTTDNPTTANPTTDEPTIASTSAPNDRTSSMPSITDLSTEQTVSDSSAMPISPDSNVNVVLVMILSSIVIVVLLISLCCCIFFLQKKRVKARVDFIATNPVNDNMNRVPPTKPVNVVNANVIVIAYEEQTKRPKNNNTQREASVSLEEIGITAEGNGNIVNDEMIGTRGGDTNNGYGNANEYQNNSNIADDEFIVRNDDDQQQHATNY
eukprot:834331_1